MMRVLEGGEGLSGQPLEKEDEKWKEGKSGGDGV